MSEHDDRSARASDAGHRDGAAVGLRGDVSNGGETFSITSPWGAVMAATNGDPDKLATALVTLPDNQLDRAVGFIQEHWGNAVAGMFITARAAHKATHQAKPAPPATADDLPLPLAGASGNAPAKENSWDDGWLAGESDANTTTSTGTSNPLNDVDVYDVSRVLTSSPLLDDNPVSRVLLGPIGNKLRQRESVRTILGADRDPAMDPVADVIGDLANDPAFTSGFAVGSIEGTGRAIYDTVHGLKDAADLAINISASLITFHHRDLMHRATSTIDELVRSAPQLLGAASAMWNAPNPIKRGHFQGQLTAYCLTTSAIVIAGMMSGGEIAATGPYAGIIRALGWIGNPIEGLTALEAGLSAKALQGIRAASQAAHGTGELGTLSGDAVRGVGAADHLGMPPRELAAVDEVAREAESVPSGHVDDVHAASGGKDPPYHPHEVLDALDQEYPDQIKPGTVLRRNQKNAKLAGKRHPKTGIVFDERGFPIFDDVAVFEARIPGDAAAIVDRDVHMIAATKQLDEAIARGEVSASRFSETQLDAIHKHMRHIPDFTWHHHQEFGRMQLVSQALHDATGHSGGFKAWYAP
jgi:DNase/tRNase domain of colicin-like bacteriocin